MDRVFIFLFYFFLLSYGVKAQTLPKDGAELNYRIIGFRLPVQQDNNYRIEIARGFYNNADSFKQHLILSADGKTNKIIAEVPDFGEQYTWRIVKAEKAVSPGKVFYHFSTGIIPNVDSNITRLRIFKNTGAYKDDHVFMDATRTLYDMKGQPVWFLPNFEHVRNENFEVRDMKLTPQGTVTFIIGDKAYEANYNASILWKAPDISKGDGSITYHHQLTRLPNGHFMILCNEDILCQRPASVDSAFVIIGENIAHDDTSRYSKIPFGTILEYDEKGKVVWSWRSINYFKSSDIIYYKDERGLPDVLPHENAFYFDKQEKVIYVSFRNISRILKVKYPEGNVVGVYGEIYGKGVHKKGNGMFCNQHCCMISEKGYLYLFNNNICNIGAPPSIVMMRQQGKENGGLQKIWEYPCVIDGISDEDKRPIYNFMSGGSVYELSDHSIFATMGTRVYNKAFIVSPDKNVLWSAFPERKNRNSGKWEPISLYKGSIITPEELEHFIWSEEGNK